MWVGKFGRHVELKCFVILDVAVSKANQQPTALCMYQRKTLNKQLS